MLFRKKPEPRVLLWLTIDYTDGRWVSYPISIDSQHGYGMGGCDGYSFINGWKVEVRHAEEERTIRSGRRASV